MILFYGVSTYFRVLSSKHQLFYGVSISDSNSSSKRSHTIDLVHHNTTSPATCRTTPHRATQSASLAESSQSNLEDAVQRDR